MGLQTELWIFGAGAPCTWAEAVPPPHLTRTWNSLWPLSGKEWSPHVAALSGGSACKDGAWPRMGQGGGALSFADIRLILSLPEKAVGMGWAPGSVWGVFC